MVVPGVRTTCTQNTSGSPSPQPPCGYRTTSVRTRGFHFLVRSRILWVFVTGLIFNYFCVSFSNVRPLWAVSRRPGGLIYVERAGGTSMYLWNAATEQIERLFESHSTADKVCSVASMPASPVGMTSNATKVWVSRPSGPCAACAVIRSASRRWPVSQPLTARWSSTTTTRASSTTTCPCRRATCKLEQSPESSQASGNDNVVKIRDAWAMKMLAAGPGPTGHECARGPVFAERVASRSKALAWCLGQKNLLATGGALAPGPPHPQHQFDFGRACCLTACTLAAACEPTTTWSCCPATTSARTNRRREAPLHMVCFVAPLFNFVIASLLTSFFFFPCRCESPSCPGTPRACCTPASTRTAPSWSAWPFCCPARILCFLFVLADLL